MVNMQNIISQIKKAGSTNVRTVPSPGADVNTGTYQIEINESGSWRAIATGLPQSTAKDIIEQATRSSNVLLG
jgi:hypothetical protein